VLVPKEVLASLEGDRPVPGNAWKGSTAPVTPGKSH